MELPDSCMSRISVSMGVLPTSRMKKSWEMRLAGTARRAGRRSSKRPKRCGWLGYCILSYSVRATWAFSCSDSTWAGSVRPHASVEENKQDVVARNISHSSRPQAARLHTRREERDGFEAAVLCCVHLQPVQLVHLVLENPDLVHEGHHPLRRHGRGVESSSCQQRSHVYGQRRLSCVQDEELAPAQPQQRHLWAGWWQRSVEPNPVLTLERNHRRGWSWTFNKHFYCGQRSPVLR